MCHALVLFITVEGVDRISFLSSERQMCHALVLFITVEGVDRISFLS